MIQLAKRLGLSIGYIEAGDLTRALATLRRLHEEAQRDEVPVITGPRYDYAGEELSTDRRKR
jgi:hypothetical protein